MLLNVVESGGGPPICLLHGLFGRLQNLAPLARRLAASFRVVSLDLRNHGASPHAAGMSYAEMVADVMDTLRGIDALPALLLGHSMGGKVAMLAALRHSEDVNGVVIADIAPIAYRHQNSRIASALQALDPTPALTRRAADAALAAAIPDLSMRGFLLQNLEFGSHPRWKIGLDFIAAGMSDIEGWPDLPTERLFAGPASFITGGASGYVPASAHAGIRARFPAAAMEVIPDAGHWLHAERPEIFAAKVEAFLRRTDRYNILGEIIGELG